MHSFPLAIVLVLALAAIIIPSASGFAARDARTRRPPPGKTARRTPEQVVERKRAPHQFDHTTEEARPFLDNSLAVKEQLPNDDAPLYIFEDDKESPHAATIPDGTHLIYVSLDELFPNVHDLHLSHKFCTDGKFRNDLRNAMREDIFDSTPAYDNMSEKARKILLLPDSSLQGSWRSNQTSLRMKKLTIVLREYLGQQAPSGDQFMEAIGALCGSEPSYHWIDIVGVMNRKIPHSWHQDTGRSRGGDTMTVLLGFPKEDNYTGVGVFSHAVKLKYEKISFEEHVIDDPVVYPGLKIDDKYVVRPQFAKGKEIVVFRDIDIVHSSPDVAYRSSVMRFM